MKQEGRFSLYWKCQLAGWSAASLYWGYTGYAGSNFSLVLALIHFAGDLLMYIAITHLFRFYSKRQQWHLLPPKKLIIRLVPAVLILGVAFMLATIAKTYLIRDLADPGFGISFRDYFQQQWLATLVTGVRLMAIWLLAYYLYHYAQREINSTRENARLSLIAKDAQLENLSAQLNPHFFFNSLNNIKALVLEDPQAARRAIDLLSELLRISLYHRDAALIPLKDEMELVGDYLELEKMRFEDRLEVLMEIDSRVEEASLPPLCIQSLVENAIKHGIAQRKQGGLISILAKPENGDLLIRVTSPGTLNPESNKGLGIKNLSERLKLQFDGKASLTLTEGDGATVSAIIKLPLT